MMNPMKNIKYFIFIQLIVMSLPIPVFAQQEAQKEYVQVVNVEMILRVLKDGAPVGGLKKADFSISEDGQPSEINGFFENRRHIAHADEALKHLQQPRLYMLFFWIGDPEADAAGVLDTFFSRIYRQGDRVILSTPLKTFELPSPQEIEGMTASFLEQWRLEAKNKHSASLRFQNDLNRLLENQVRRMVEILENKSRPETESIPGREKDTEAAKEIDILINEYTRALQEYRLRELSPDMTAFEAMARSMTANKNDKFALVFNQRDSMPFYDIANVKNLCETKELPEALTDTLASEMLRIEERTKNSFNVRIFSEQLKSLFIQANIQFHLLSLSPDKSDRHANASSFFSLVKREEVFSYWDQVMQEVSKITGGLRLDGNRMAAALEQMIDFEDIYYHVTYIPRVQGGKKRKIDIRVNQPGMQVLFGRTMEMATLPLLKIAGIAADSQFIRLDLVDFYPIAKDGVPTGFVHVELTGRQADHEPAQTLLSEPSETAGTVELPFAFPKPGNWDLEVRVTDQITGQIDVKTAKVEIAAAISAYVAEKDSAKVLANLLAKAAAYAEKLKKVAFHFLCREEVTEEVFFPKSSKNPVAFSKRNGWRYDYQIICKDGKIKENRVLLDKNREKAHQDKAQLETMFQSYYSFFMPVTFLAREKQHLYQYRLLGKEKVNNKNFWHVVAIRRFPGAFPSGELWVSEEDGTVAKIQPDQTSIIGFEKLAQDAIEKGFMPAITTIHEYNLEKKGICFPSKTIFIERYNPGVESMNKPVVITAAAAIQRQSASFEHSRTYFEYHDHMFFSVSTHVDEKTE